MSGSNASHILTIADIKTVLEELANEVTSKWYQIGIQLEVRLDNLNSLRQQNTGDNTANLCHVLVTWIKSGKATWEALCKALESSTVAENALAGKLRTDYCMPSSAEGNAQESDSASTSEANSDKKQKPTGVKRLVKTAPQRFTKDDFVQNQKADRFCCKCKQVPFTPQRSSCCGSLYCDVCSVKVTTGTCFKCKENPLPFKKDQELHSKIQKLKIKCPNRTRDCTWKGEVYKLKKHLNAECNAIIIQGKKTGKDGSKTGESAKTPKKATTTTGESSAAQQSKSTSSTKASAKKTTRKRANTQLSPPLNLVMQDVLSYKDSGEFWLSDSFYSHQLGYKLALAVKVENGSGDKTIKVTLALVSSEGKQSKYLDYPCIGNATVYILNPEINESTTVHEQAEFLFMLENKDPQSYPDLSEQTEISLDFIRKDCLFFRVDKVEMTENNYKLWLLDTKYFKK